MNTQLLELSGSPIATFQKKDTQTNGRDSQKGERLRQQVLTTNLNLALILTCCPADRQALNTRFLFTKTPEVSGSFAVFN